MKISNMRVRLTFQKNETVVDDLGNHTSAWTDHYSCWASVKLDRETQTEEEAAHTIEKDEVDITVRFCSEIAAVDVKGYRILIKGKIYKILSIDEMGFQKYSRKFRAALEER